MRIVLIAALLSLSLPAFAQYESPLGARHAVAGPHTSMLTIGSTHLSAHSGKWPKEWLEPLVQRLVAYQPQLITVEQLSGSQCETMRGNPAVFGEVFEDYCRDATPFQRLSRMTQPQAAAEAERQLAAWPAAPTPVQRRHLAICSSRQAILDRRWCSGCACPSPGALPPMDSTPKRSSS